MKKTCLTRRVVMRRNNAPARSNHFCLVESLIICASTRRNDLSRRSVFAIRRTEVALIFSSWAISRVLRWVPVSSSWEQISSWTFSIFSTVRTVAGRPLPGWWWTTEPFRSIHWQIFLTVSNFHPYTDISQRLLLHQILVHSMSAFEVCHRKILYPLLIEIN